MQGACRSTNDGSARGRDDDEKMKYKVVHVVEYAALCAVAGLIRALPLRMALAMSWVLAAGSHFVGRVNVARTHERLRQVFGDALSEKAIRHAAWISWRNLFFNGIEMIRCDRLTLEVVRKHPMARLEPEMQRLMAAYPKGFILATPHNGNWEIAAVAADLSGVPISAMVRRQKNPLVDRWINRMRRSFNLELIFREAKMFKGVVDRLKSGRVLAILPDIHARGKGVCVDFLNGRAHISPGVAQFAQLAECPIIPVVMKRIGWTVHDATMFEPILPNPDADKKEELQRMMQELMSCFSEEILQSPEQYFWYNKRWVLSLK
jgi:Kdo2-lipid IVA lauroyltransferase/acyltransferase